MMSFPIKFVFMWLVLIGSCASAYTQSLSKKDSLKLTIKKNKSDTLEVIAWFNLGKILVKKSVDSAKICYEKGFSLSKKLNFKKGISDYYSQTIFIVSEYENNTKLAFKMAKEYEEFALKEKNEYFLAYSYFTTAVCYAQIEKFEPSIQYYEKSLILFQKLKKDSKAAVIYGNISNIYGDMKMYDVALEYGLKDLEYNTKLKDTNRIIIANINLSAKYDKIKKKDMVAHERCNREALRLALKVKNYFLTMVAYVNLGEMFGNKMEFDSSIVYFLKAKPLSESFGSKQIQAEILVRITDIYEQKKDFQKANFYLKSAMENESINEITYEMKKRFLDLKIRLFKREGKYEEATKLFEEYIKISDSTNVISTQEKVLEFNNKLKKAETEKVILSKEVEINKQKTWIYLLSSIGVALLLLGFLFYRYQNKKQKLNLNKSGY